MWLDIWLQISLSIHDMYEYVGHNYRLGLFKKGSKSRMSALVI